MKNINLCICLLFSSILTGEAFADLAPEAYAFSSLIQKSDLIVTGYVSERNESPMEYQYIFIIERSVKNPLNRNEIVISVPLANGLPIPIEGYLHKGTKYLLFLYSDGNVFKITNYSAGVLKEKTFSDIDLLFTSFNENNSLFSKSSVEELKRIFRKFSSDDTRYRLLIDLKKYLSTEDALFLTELLDSENERYIIFAVLQIGSQNIKILRPRVIQLLVGPNSSGIKFHCLVALGGLGDIESIDLISSYLNHSNQGMRAAAIQSLGRIGTIEVIGPLKLSYADENYDGNRISIITALSRNLNREAAFRALKDLESVPASPLVSSFLKKKIDSLSSPIEYFLSNNYPNPFNPVTRIEFSLPEAGLTRLIIYDLRGVEVERLINKHYNAGYHTVKWDGRGVASGIYYYRLVSGNFAQTKKMLLLK